MVEYDVGDNELRSLLVPEFESAYGLVEASRRFEDLAGQVGSLLAKNFWQKIINTEFLGVNPSLEDAETYTTFLDFLADAVLDPEGYLASRSHACEGEVIPGEAQTLDLIPYTELGKLAPYRENRHVIPTLTPIFTPTEDMDDHPPTPIEEADEFV